MADISTTLSVDVVGIGDVRSMAQALAELDEAADKAMATLGRPIAFAGLGDLGTQFDAAATQAEAAALRIDTALKGIGEGAAGGLSGLSGQLKGLDDVADSAAGSLAAAGDALKEVDAAGAGAGASLGAAADKAKTLGEGLDAVKGGAGSAAEGLKATGAAAADTRDTIAGLTEGVGASTDALKVNRDFMVEYAATMKASTAMMAENNTVAAMASDTHDYATAIKSAGEATDDVTASQVYNATMARNASVQQKAAQEDAAASAEASAGKYHMLALGIAGTVGYGTYLAANLQTGVNRLYTSAGESQANLPLISKGILALSGQTDTSQASLLSGAYMTESAGFHGKDALAVLRSASEGAYSEGADLGTTGNALTTVLDDYFGGAQKSPVKQQDQATAAMNAIMASVGAGKMTLQGISTALPVVLPKAQQAGLKLPQVLGAMSTLTAEGTSPDEAAQELQGTITRIQKPSNVATAEMQMLGINPLQLEKGLGKQGLTGTIQEADAAIQKHTRDGMVQLDVANQSKLAYQSANAAITQLPRNLQSVAEGYLKGTTTRAEWYGLTGSKSTLPEKDVNLLNQFGTVANNALGLSAMIKAGQGDKQTQAAALNEMFGGQTGQAVALGLGGDHMKTFAGDVDTIGRSVSHTGTNIQGWSRVQDSLNFKLGSFVKSLEAVATEAGQVVLPGLTKIAGGASDVLGFAASHQALTQDALLGGGILALPAILSKVTSAGTTIAASAGKIGQVLGVPGADKLANLGKGTSAAAGSGALDDSAARLSGAGGDLAGAAGDLSGAAGKIATAAEENALPGKGGLPGESGGGEPVPVGTAGKTAAEDAEATDGEDAAKGIGGGIALSAISSALTSGAVVGAVADGVERFIADRLPAPTPSAVKSVDDHGSFNKYMANLVYGQRGAPRVTSFFDTLQHDVPVRHGTAVGFDDTRHFAAAQGDTIAAGAKNTADWVTSGFDGNRHAAASIGDAVASFFGFGSHPAAPPKPSPVDAAQAYGESAIAPARPLPASTAAALAKSAAASADVKLKVNVDDAALGAAKAHIASMLASLDGGKQVKPVVIPAPNLSAVEGAKSKVAADMGAITGTMKSEAGAAASAGATVASGFAGGIASGSGAVAAAATSLGETAMASLRSSIQSRSPSKLTEVEGANYDAGLILGIEAGKGAVANAAAGVGKTAVDALKGTAKIGKDTVATLTADLQGGSDAVSAAKALATGIAAPFKDSTISGTITTLEGDVADALKKHKVSASDPFAQLDQAEATGLDKYLAAAGARMQKLAGQRASLEAKIQQAQGYAQNITASANAGANIMTIAGNVQAADSATGPAPAAAPVQASDLISGMQQQVAQTKKFSSDLAELKKKGLNKAEIDQIAQSGAAAGDPVAQSILAGGPGAIKQLDKLQAQMNAAAKQLGQTASNAVYAPAKDIGDTVAKGLKASLSKVDQEMSTTGKDILSTLHAALTGGAAAAAFAGIGTTIANDIAQGIGAASAAIAKAVQDAAEGKSKPKSGGSSSSPPAHSSAVSHPATAAGGGSGSPGGSSYGGSPAAPAAVQHTTHIHVMLDGAEVGRSTQSWMLAHGSQNQQTGVVPKGQNKTA